MCPRIWRSLLAAVASVSLNVSTASAGADAMASSSTANPRAQLPVVFEPNVGQFTPDIRLAARVPAGVLKFSVDGVSIDRGASRVRWTLRGGRRVVPQGVERAAGVINYLLGRNPRAWRTHVPTYGRVRYQEVYRGIDIEYYAGGGGLEFDVRVAPGSDPRDVRFTIAGAQGVHLDPSGAAVMETADGVLSWRMPVAYQDIAGTRQPVAVAYVVDGREVRFRIGRYDRTRPLVIDPAFAFSTLLNGAGSDAALDVAADREGFVYVAGGTDSLTFPNPDPDQQRRSGGEDAFVLKLTPDGASLVYASFIGGSFSDRALAIATDAEDRAHIAGLTVSPDWPTQRAIQGACGLDDTGFCYDAFVAELTRDGDALEFSTYVGGSGFDYANSIAVGPQDRIAVGGNTDSPDFPVPGAFDSTCDSPCGDGFVVLLAPRGNVLERGTYLGGTASDLLNDVDFLSDGRVVATGDTNSSDFPVTIARLGPGGGNDVFITVFAASGSSLDVSGLLGGTLDDFGSRVAVGGPSDGLFVSGWTNSPDFPVRHAVQPLLGGGSDAFVTRIDLETWSIVFSTFFGGSRGDSATDIGVDASGTAIIVGNTLSFDLPTASAQQRGSSVSVCIEFRGSPLLYCPDAFVAAIDASGRLLYSTYLGSYGTDSASSVFVGADGSAWVSGSTAIDFPTTPRAVHRTSPYRDALFFPGEPFVTRFLPPLATRILTTFAGSGDQSTSTPDIAQQAVLRALGRPSDVDVSPSGDVLIADSALNRTLNVNTSNHIFDQAGSGEPGFQDGFQRMAQFNGPSGIAGDSTGVYIADTQNHRVRALQAPVVFTIAGSGTAGYSGDGGPSIEAELNGPLAVAVGAGTIIIADTGNRRIRRITADGTITTIAGTGAAGSSGDGGPAVAAMLTLPTGVAFDPSGGIVIADWGANVVRRVAPDGSISTLAGTGAPGYGGDEGPATSAQLNGPYGVDVDAHGRVYVADMFNHRVRMIAPDGTIHTVAGTGEPGTIASPQRAATETPLWYPAGVAVGIDNDLFITDLGNQRVARVIRIDGTVP